MAIDILRIPVLSDNYVWAARDRATGHVAVIDPAEADPVLAALQEQGWRLDWILNTHHHPDHTGGNLALHQATGCRIAGAQLDADRLPGLTHPLDDSHVLMIGETPFQMLMVPGHTAGHCAYHVPSADIDGTGDGALFCGDTLFVLGCGRLFEGTAGQMWRSLARLLALPEATRVYCAHEYTLSNARFALAVDGDNPGLQARVAEIQAARDAGEATVPGRLAEERLFNPFLRSADPAFAAQLGLAGASPEAVFAHLRSRKDTF